MKGNWMKSLLALALTLCLLLGSVAAVAEEHEHIYGSTVVEDQEAVYTPVDASTHRVTIDRIEYPVCGICHQYGSTS